MTKGIITLRPHHIAKFQDYCLKRPNPFDKLNLANFQEKYGENFTKKIKSFFDLLASGKTSEKHILVKSGLDTICSMCPRKIRGCAELDLLNPWNWNGSKQVMQDMDLREGWLYPLEKFLEKVKQLYPDRNPNRR